MFADMKSMVTKAWREHYALLAINCMNLESARAAVFEAGKAALLHTLCHDSSRELVDVLIAMEQASEEAIIPYLQASGAIGKA